MDCVDSYFDIMFETLCGIPHVTLEGKMQDWELLVQSFSSPPPRNILVNRLVLKWAELLQ